MLVKAKWNVKGSDGWHMAGEVFSTEEDFGAAVEVLDAPKKAEPKAAEPKAPVKQPEQAPAEAEKPKAEAPRTQQRRKR